MLVFNWVAPALDATVAASALVIKYVVLSHVMEYGAPLATSVIVARVVRIDMLKTGRQRVPLAK